MKVYLFYVLENNGSITDAGVMYAQMTQFMSYHPTPPCLCQGMIAIIHSSKLLLDCILSVNGVHLSPALLTT